MRLRHYGRRLVAIWSILQDDNLPKSLCVTEEPDAPNTVCRLPGPQVIGVEYLSKRVDFVPGLIQAMGLVSEAIAKGRHLLSSQRI